MELNQVKKRLWCPFAGLQESDINTDSHALERDTMWTQDGGSTFMGVFFTIQGFRMVLVAVDVRVSLAMHF